MRHFSMSKDRDGSGRHETRGARSSFSTLRAVAASCRCSAKRHEARRMPLSEQARVVTALQPSCCALVTHWEGFVTIVTSFLLPICPTLPL